MAGSSGSNTRVWLALVAAALALLFLNRYFMIGLQTVLQMVGQPVVNQPVAQPTSADIPSQVATNAAATAAAFIRPVEATKAPAISQLEPAAHENVTINLWHQWTDQELQGYEIALNQYRAEHPWVTIQYQRVENFEDQMAAAGAGPDLISTGNDYIGAQAANGTIVPLSNYGITGFYMASTFVPAAVEAVTWEGQTWGIPQEQNGIAFIYNKKLVPDVYRPTDPTNFDALLSKARLFQSSYPGQTLFCNPGFGNSDAYHNAPIFFGMGVPNYIDEAGNVHLDTPEGLRAAEFIQAAREVTIQDPSYDKCMNGFLNGSIGMWWTGPWSIPMVEDYGIDYGILPMGRPFVGFRTLMMTRAAVEMGKDAAVMDIILYLTTPEVQKELTLANRTIPTISALFNDPLIASMEDISGFGAALRNGEPISPYAITTVQWGSVGNAVTNIWFGYSPLEDILAAAQAETEQAVAGMR